MAIWTPTNTMLTVKGLELLSKVQSGVGKLTISKVLTSSGRVDNSELENLLQVTTPQQSMDITQVNTSGSGSTLNLQITNVGLTKSYGVNQIGVYASHPDMGEILYMIAQCDEGTEDIVPLPSVTPVTLNYVFYLIHSASTNLDVTIDPAGLITREEFQGHIQKFDELCNFVGYNPDSTYGVEIDYANGTYTRLGSNVGKSAGANFDELAPWGGRRRCIICNSDTMQVPLAYYGEEGYTESGKLSVSITKNGVTYPVGTNVQVMVEQPKFWYKVVPIELEKILDNNAQGYSIRKARYYVSPVPAPGFKVFPAFVRGNNKEVDFVYLGAFLGSVYSNANPVAEVNTMKVLMGANQAGSIDIILDGYEEPVSIYIDEADVTGKSVASKIRNAVYPGWEVSGTDSDVIFTCLTTGCRNTVKFVDTGGTSVKVTVTKTTKGLGGYIKNDAYESVTVSDSNTPPYNCDFLCSVAGVKPTSNFNVSNLMKLCTNRNSDASGPLYGNEIGMGWCPVDLAMSHINIWLFLIEYATLDSQTAVGLGVCKLPDDRTQNFSVYNGLTTSLGNTTGCAVGEPGSVPVSYRGVENAWGDMSVWLSGVIVKRDTPASSSMPPRIYISTSGSDLTVLPETDIPETFSALDFIPPQDSGFCNRVGYSEKFDWSFIASSYEGTSSMPTHDYCSFIPHATKQSGCLFYGYWASIRATGITPYMFKESSKETYVTGRLAFVPNKY